MKQTITRRVGALIVVLLWLLAGGSSATGLVGPVQAASTSTTVPWLQISSDTLPSVAEQDSSFDPGPAPATTGKSVILVNMDDGRVLVESNADERRSIASTTKIMTGILALETLPLDRMVQASVRATQAGESEIWMEPGEELSVEDLMYALLVRSANDAAVALGEASAGTLEAFIDAMNAKAVELGLTNTHFANPHGLEAEGHYSSARDLATLARYAMQNPDFRRFVATEEVAIPWPGRPYDRVLESRNTLLGKVAFVNGVKTGYTRPAGFCLVGSGARDGVSLISVILGEPNKDAVNADSAALLEYGFRQYRQVSLMERGVTVTEMDVPYHFGETMVLKTDRDLVRTIHAADPIVKTVTVQERLVLPVTKGQVLGTITFEAGGNEVGEIQLLADRTIEEASLGVKLRYIWDRVVDWLGRAV
jgi:D-alanyl-D-alanine carboxypeptidase (penicillin-binding protein 5/6)